MKEVGTNHWNSPNTGATNESGFTSLPGGLNSYGYGYNGLNENSNFWNATPGWSYSSAFSQMLSFDDARTANGDPSKIIGMSCRCLKE
jgi:uncharacterized protein (TIGR02145 family)